MLFGVVICVDSRKHSGMMCLTKSIVLVCIFIGNHSRKQFSCKEENTISSINFMAVIQDMGYWQSAWSKGQRASGRSKLEVGMRKSEWLGKAQEATLKEKNSWKLKAQSLKVRIINLIHRRHKQTYADICSPSNLDSFALCFILSALSFQLWAFLPCSLLL